MSDDFFRRLTLIFGIFAIAAIFCMQGLVANIEVKDLDLWLHIGMGRHIVNNHFSIPQVDILSSSVSGTPWVNHEWLFQVIVYLIYQAAGPDGLIMMQVVLVSLTGMILFLLGYNREKQFLAILSFLFVSLIYQMRFTIRPDLFSLLFFVLYVWMLSFFLNRKWLIPVLLVLQILWTNNHGFFFFGPFFILIGLIAEWLKRHVRLPWEWNTMGRLTDQEYARLKLALAAVVIGCLVNPLTFKGAWYPIGVFFQISGESSIFFSHIMELEKPIKWATAFSLHEFPYYKLLILISAVSFIFNRRKIDLSVFFFWAVFLGFSLVAMRNMVYFAFAAYLVFMNNVSDLSFEDVFPIEFTDKKFLDIVTVTLKILIIIWVSQYIIEGSGHGYFDFDTYERKSEFRGVSQMNFPIQAVDFLVENEIKGNIYNEFNSGAYLVGRCFPNIKVFIDGRTELYGPAFFKRYLKIVREQDVKVLKEVIEENQITIAFISTIRDQGPDKILKYFKEQEDWILVYLDYDGVIFLKDIPGHAEVINRYKIDLDLWQVKNLDVYRLGSRKVVPFRHVNRAYTLASLGATDAAFAECEAAVKIYPGYPEAFALMAQIYAKRKDYENAFQYFRLAVTYNSGNRDIRTNFARTYEDLGYYQYAIEQFDKVIERFPKHPAAYFMAARVLVKIGNLDAAFRYADTGFQLDKNAVKDIIELGDLCSEKGYDDASLRFYEIARGADKRQDQLHVRIGDLFQKMGRMDEARTEWQAALEALNSEQQNAVLNRMAIFGDSR